MPNVSSVNLSFLNTNKTGSAAALINLADLANGPLRLQKKVENGMTVTYLGVRSWSTYFFEKLIATPDQIARAKIKTQVAINRNVRSFLNNSGMTFGGRNAEDLTSALQSKVVRKSVTPAATDQDDKASTKPGYRKPPEVVETKGKAFHGATLVPTGLSVAVISPLRVIADVRLVAEATFKTHPGSDSRNGHTASQGDFVIASRNGLVAYKTQYLDHLKSVAGLIQTSVVLEVQRDAEGECSEANLEGAREAATEFAKRMKAQGKHVSVMLTVPELPSVTQPDSPTVKKISTASKGRNDPSPLADTGTNTDSNSESESSEASSS